MECNNICLSILLFGFVSFLFGVRSNSLSKHSTCRDDHGLNYTLLMFEVCPERPDGNGKMVATIPKLIPVAHPQNGSCPISGRARITGHRLCRFPDCLGNPCKDCWCEETLIGFKCLCGDGYARGKPDINECSSNPCGDHGVCHDQKNGYTCECNDGWTGTYCETDINECSSNPCGDHGVCHVHINGYTCECNDGWNGTYCEKDINECSSNPCGDHGVCHVHINGYTCECNDGWNGTYCEKDINECSSNPCGDHGVCHVHINGYTCECNDGWNGTYCEKDIIECSSNPCGDHSVCYDHINGYTCECNDGWNGTYCETAICPSGWFYHGQKCFFREIERMLWTAAKEYCGKKRVTLSGGIGTRQASLLLVETQEEADFIANKFMRNHEAYPRIWINCNDELTEGRWVCESDASGTVLPYRSKKNAHLHFCIINFGIFR
ncbi:fibropellin-1-like [Lytechinus pictus]|uniref:fibropellin-1-like n=1 Tax=Lytechinus pictus TaxID=7653 RepID=UPI0030BA112A